MAPVHGLWGARRSLTLGSDLTGPGSAKETDGIFPPTRRRCVRGAGGAVMRTLSLDLRRVPQKSPVSSLRKLKAGGDGPRQPRGEWALRLHVPPRPHTSTARLGLGQSGPCPPTTTRATRGPELTLTRQSVRHFKRATVLSDCGSHSFLNPLQWDPHCDLDHRVALGESSICGQHAPWLVPCPHPR